MEVIREQRFVTPNHFSQFFSNYSKHDDYFNSFPPGYRFHPTEEELIIFYLMKKIMNEPLPPNQMLEVDVYQHDPQILCRRYKSACEKEWYFFSPRERKYPNGVRPKRSTKDGYWKVSGSDRLIYSKGMIVGKWNTLVYYRGKAPTGTKTNWIMREYKLAQHSHKRTGAFDMMLENIKPQPTLSVKFLTAAK
ncbi:NAC transcription factor 29-like [Prosopis cineraria]|uniref:NAC transcription factor 29-like n=1 Tax=Prosopis cineraria TaxID=364024 RepID=UPI00240F4F98|nr:NAC transcription factor 29-like [Prosopis cineraria]